MFTLDFIRRKLFKIQTRVIHVKCMSYYINCFFFLFFICGECMIINTCYKIFVYKIKQFT